MHNDTTVWYRILPKFGIWKLIISIFETDLYQNQYIVRKVYLLVHKYQRNWRHLPNICKAFERYQCFVRKWHLLVRMVVYSLRNHNKPEPEGVSIKNSYSPHFKWNKCQTNRLNSEESDFWEKSLRNSVLFPILNKE